MQSLLESKTQIMNYKRAKTIETCFFPILWKSTYLILFLFSVHFFGQHASDAISKTIPKDNKDTRKPFIYITKGTIVVNLPASEDYNIINLNVKTESNDGSSKKSTVRKTKKLSSKALHKSSINYQLCCSFDSNSYFSGKYSVRPPTS